MSSDFILDDEMREHMFATDKLCDQELEQALLRSGGPVDALIVGELPDGTRHLVDGYRRHRICEQHHLSYAVDVKKFESREAIFDFMDSLQLSRRNLPPNQMSLLRARRKTRHEKELGATAAAAETAKVHGVSTRTVFRDQAYSEAVKKVAPKLRKRAVDKLSQAQTLALSQLPLKQQSAAMAEPKRLRKKRAPSTFGDAAAEAGKLVAKLQNALEDVNKVKADAIRLRSCKQRAQQIGELLDDWATSYKDGE